MQGWDDGIFWIDICGVYEMFSFGEGVITLERRSFGRVLRNNLVIQHETE